MIEKKRKKRALHFVVTGALVVAPASALAGCGGGESEEPHTNVAADTGDEEPHTNVAADDTDVAPPVVEEDEEEIPDPVDPDESVDGARGEGADDAADILPGSQQDVDEEP